MSRRFISRPRAYGLPWPVPIFCRRESPNLQRSELRVFRFHGICSTRFSELGLEAGRGWAARVTQGSRIEHVPVVSQRPAKRGELPVNHTPFEVGPRSEVFLAVLTFDSPRGLESALPHVTLDGLTRSGRARIRCLFYNLDSSFLDTDSSIPVPVVPDLIEEQVFSLQNL